MSSAELTKLALEPLSIMLDVKNQRVVVNGGAYIFCDRRWTAEALTNIVKNAHEHSPEGGEIAVAAGANPICAWISVTDSGAGVERDDIKKIFKRFETGGNGYGIGLPLALSIMRGQNGDIEVTGNTFTMKFYNEIK